MTGAGPKPPKPALGWREWVALPGVGVEAVKAKLDTGARSSALHAFDVHRFERDGRPWVRFSVHPLQRSTRETIVAEAPLAEERWITSSNGHRSRRPVILTDLELDGKRWPIELTLTARDEMGFRMLLGREALRPGYVVDPGRSYLAGRGPTSPRRSSARSNKRSREKT